VSRGTQKPLISACDTPDIASRDSALVRGTSVSLSEALESQIKRGDRLTSELAEAHVLIRDLTKDIRLLQDRVKDLQFGNKRRERWDPNQPMLPFDEIAQESHASNSEATVAEGTSDCDEDGEPRRKRKKHRGRNAISPLLARHEVVHEMSSDELDERYGPGNWTVIGREITETLDSTAASIHVVRNIRLRYGSVDRKLPPITAVADQVIPKGKAGAGLLARIITSKYLDGLPLYRQQMIMKREGAEISRSTMVGWMKDCASALLPITHHLRDEIIASGVVIADETPVTVLERRPSPAKAGEGGEERGKGKFKGYLWGYMNPEIGAYYDFRRTRSRHGPDEVLAGLRGVLQSDGYSAYPAFAKSNDGVELAGCWVHVRRNFFNCRKAYPVECTRALGLIRQIYRIETKLRRSGASADEILITRADKTATIIDSFEEFINGDFSQITPGSALGKALSYARNRMPTLRRFLRDPSMDPDTNEIERCMKIVAIIRKNFLFFGSEEGGRFGAVLFTLVLNCRLFDLDPWRYLKWALTVATSATPPPPEAMTPMAWSRSQLVTG
jgi:transposase